MLTLTRRAIAAITLLIVLTIGCGSAPATTTRPTATAGGAAQSPSGAPPTQTVAPLVTPTTAASLPDLSSLIPTDPALLTGVVPAGWQVIEDETGKCQMAAPPEWNPDILPASAATSALSEGLAGVSANTEEWDSWTATVDQIYLTGHVTLIDTPDAFLIANPIGGDFAYVLVRRFDDVNCMILVTVKANWISQYAAPAALISTTLDHTD
jgi:hypothetical protein